MARSLRSQFGNLREYTVAELRAATSNFHPIYMIGEGGFGRVYRAMVLLTPVAVKVLDHEGLQGLTEFHNEVNLASMLNHPHLVQLLGYAAEGDTQCLVYELMANGNLEDRLACKNGVAPIPWPARVKVSSQISQALLHLHSRGIIHRDIKPANMFLDCNLSAKLGDIGLASSQSLLSSSAHSSEAIGTWSYLAPEYRSQGRCSTKTDVYAFGLVLMQLVSGDPDPRGIITKCHQALCNVTLPTILDRRAGAWDQCIAERLIKLGLWCTLGAEERPDMTKVHQELNKMQQRLQEAGILKIA